MNHPLITDPRIIGAQKWIDKMRWAKDDEPGDWDDAQQYLETGDATELVSAIVFSIVLRRARAQRLKDEMRRLETE